MKNKNISIVTGVILMLSASMATGELSDMKAAQAAKDMLQSIEKAQTEFGTAVQANDKNAYLQRIRPILNDVIQKWPLMHKSNHAIFPYWECNTAALDFIAYGDAIFLMSNLEWAQRKKRQLNQSIKNCTTSIESPDMNLKTVN